MTISALMSAADPATAPTADAKPTKVDGAAKQFEALMIAQMMRTARENTEQTDSSGSTMLDLADQQFSQVLADSGGLGLAKLVVRGLNQGQANADRHQHPEKLAAGLGRQDR